MVKKYYIKNIYEYIIEACYSLSFNIGCGNEFFYSISL
jgi:hypothetical protein